VKRLQSVAKRQRRAPLPVPAFERLRSAAVVQNVW
jgi:hypothetical protein